MNAPLRNELAQALRADGWAAAQVRDRAEHVLRPAGALQRLDNVAVHIASWQGSPTPRIDHPTVLMFAGDHGVAVADVSNYPADITASMLGAVRAGKATINALATAAQASLEVFDVGVGRPTGDIRFEAAMSPDRFDDVITTAIEAVDNAASNGTDLLVLGELGIANTTIAAALSAALLGGDSSDWVGRGTGVDDEGMKRKRTAVRKAVARVASIDDAIEIMRQIGGTELTAVAAACAAARNHRIPVVLDGYVATAAVLPLHVAQPGALDHCLAGHLSNEPGHRRILDHLGKQPLLDLGMCLGEGSGALAAVPLIKMACASVVAVATFDEWFGK